VKRVIVWRRLRGGTRLATGVPGGRDMMFHSHEDHFREGEASLHIPLEVLWSYSHDEFEVSDNQMHHLLNCDECVSAMGLCHILPTMNRVEEEMAMHCLAGKP
jgi:hypothetical protein